MGQDLGQLFHELESEVWWLHHKWNEFKELFGKEQERMDLLNEVASNFFYLVHQVLYENVMLSLCRLTDPPESRSRQLRRKVRNLTFLCLSDLISDPSLRVAAEAAAQQIRQKSEFARDWRDRRLAHIDLMTLRNSHPLPLPVVDAKHVDDALQSIGDLFDLLYKHYSLSPVLLSFYSNPWGAGTLVHYLETAVWAKGEERRRRRNLMSAGRKKDND